MTSSDWKSQAQNQHEYSANTLKALSVDIAQRLEMQGGKKKVKNYELLTKNELVIKAKAKGIKGVDALKKDKLIAVLRGKK
jgi:hypothetical protein